MKKTCTKCQVEKELSQFYKRDKNRYFNICIECKTIYSKEYKRQNKDKERERNKVCYQNNIEQYKSRGRKYKAEHKDERREKSIQNRVQNNKKFLNKYHNDPIFKLKLSLRVRLNQAIKKNQKVGSAVRDLGCSIDYFKQYLESKFQLGMTWQNHTKYGWHIDHIKPLCLFDMTDPAQFKQACHYTNLQPLWAIDNLKKGSTYANIST